MRILARIAAPLLAMVLLLPATPAAQPPPASPGPDAHPALQRDLREGTVDERRQALLELRSRGTHADVGVIAEHSLHDEDPLVRSLAEDTLWAIWMRSGEERIDRMLWEATELMASGAHEQAVEVLDRVVSAAPDFAEGYNKRATALFEMGEYRASLEDVEATLARNPYHFGALSGGGLCLLHLQRPRQALDYFDRALEVNPNMNGIRELRRRIRERLQQQAA